MQGSAAPEPYARFKATRVFGSLDGLRAASILAVIWSHSASGSFRDITLLQQGSYGVTLFFTISGFLISTLLLRERAKYGRISLRDFYIRRTLRIWPLYYAVLGLYTVLVLVMERGTSRGAAFMHNLPSYATYTSNLFVSLTDQAVIFYFAWSLAAEEQFYLVWPLVMRLLRPPGPLVFILGLLALTGVSLSGYGGAQLSYPHLAFKVLDRSVGPISTGVLLAILLDSPASFGVLWRVLGRPWSSVAAAAWLLFTLAFPKWLEPWDTPASWLGLFLLVGSCVVQERHWLAPVLRFKPVALVGVLSYGMYLMHMLSMNAVKIVLKRLGAETPIAEFGLSVPFTVLAAWISYRYYEGYFLRLKKKFSRVPMGEPAPSAPGETPAASAGGVGADQVQTDPAAPPAVGG
jgi:peptidoglycan/LPS O-acetylase OafA/YrhL